MVDLKVPKLYFQNQFPNFVQKIRWPKPKPINEKLRLRPINQLIGRPLIFNVSEKKQMTPKELYNV